MTTFAGPCSSSQGKKVPKGKGQLRNITRLELHVVHACNLACESCSHYSNHRLTGMLAPEEAHRWMSLWSHRLNPAFFALLGGEPTIHPQLVEFIPLIRKHWPEATLQIVTNGFFLDRHPDLPRRLADDSNASLVLSVHHGSLDYWVKFGPQWDLLIKWMRKYKIQVELRESYGNWTRRYKGFGAEMEPFQDENPRGSWETCPARICPQLFEGRIWKCGPLAYLGVVNAQYPLSSKWRPYLDYVPLGPECTDTELNGFFDREEEPACGMCPAQRDPFSLRSPLVHAADSAGPYAPRRRAQARSIPLYLWRRLSFRMMVRQGR